MQDKKLGIVLAVFLTAFLLFAAVYGLRTFLNERDAPVNAATVVAKEEPLEVAAVEPVEEEVSTEAKVETTEAEEEPTSTSQEATAAESAASLSGGDEPIPGCPQAADLGPWAPSASGEGETFEVTAARGPVHVGLWWPSGRTPEGEEIPWGDTEVSLVLEPGLSILVINGAGRGWDYPAECPRAEVDRQVRVYREGGRSPWTSFHGAVQLETLLDLGLVEIRVDNRGKTMAQSSTQSQTQQQTQQTAPSSGTIATCPDGEREDHQPTVGETWTPAGKWRVVNFWTNEPGHDQSERKLLLGPDDDVALLGGGSSWSWPADCEDAARENFASNSLPEVTLDELRGEGLVR